MKVTVLSATKYSGTSNNKPYEFVSALLDHGDDIHAGNYKINKTVCEDLNSIKKGAQFDMRVTPDGMYVTVFNLIKSAPEGSADNIEGVRVDVSSGEVIEEIPAPGNENKAGGQTPGKK